MTATAIPQNTAGTVRIGHLDVHPLTVSAVANRLTEGWERGRGGVVVTPNIDIFQRTRQNKDELSIVRRCELVVADGMPLIWSARLAGQPLPERVTGSGLVEALAEAAAREGRSLFIIGGGPSRTSEQAAEALTDRYPGLRVVGAVTPPLGFEENTNALEDLSKEVVDSKADLVYIGLGFPKQERLGLRLSEQMPATWFLGCGAGVQMAAGTVSRAPLWMQRIGAEWVARLLQEPRRLVKRYLRDDLPVALGLLCKSAMLGIGRR